MQTAVHEFVVTLAKKAAVAFAAEFPGQRVDGTDWDATAWECDRDEVTAAFPESKGDQNLWPIYFKTIHAEVPRLAAEYRERMEREDAERRAAALDKAFGNSGAHASAVKLDGDWYVVTTGTGEGYDFAYLTGDVDPDEVSRPREVNEDGEHVGGWDYSEWCNSTNVAEGFRIAVAYYMATGRMLGLNGAGSVLDEGQRRALETAKDLLSL